MENTSKWKLQERDDWKALVDTLQSDRRKLQEDCKSLTVSLQESKEYCQELQTVIESLNHDKTKRIINDGTDSEGSSPHMTPPGSPNHLSTTTSTTSSTFAIPSSSSLTIASPSILKEVRHLTKQVSII